MNRDSYGKTTPAIAAAIAVEIRRNMTPSPRKKCIGLPRRKIHIPQEGLFHRGRDLGKIRTRPVSNTAQVSEEVTVVFHHG